MLAEADPHAAGCRDDRGLTPFHYLARNPGCTVVLHETLFPFANQVYQAPKWQERAKFFMSGWRQSPSTNLLCDVYKSVMQIAVFDEDSILITKSEELLSSVSIVLASGGR
jgi:hypothetical protein